MVRCLREDDARCSEPGPAADVRGLWPKAAELRAAGRVEETVVRCLKGKHPGAISWREFEASGLAPPPKPPRVAGARTGGAKGG
eukprot:SAG22_NODE_1251_length_5005_cov_22.891154_10_plen_84_part_00